MSAVIPYLTASDAKAAIAFYEAGLGAAVKDIWTGEDGRIGFADCRLGAARWFVADAYPEMKLEGVSPDGPVSVSLVLTVADAAAVDAAHARALKAGAFEERAPIDQGDGARRATFRDPTGHRWIVSTPG